MADEEAELKHPALKNFSEGVYTAKHVAGKTVKGALWGGLIGGVAIPAVVGLAAVAGVAASGPVGWALTALGGGGAAAILGGEAIGGAIASTAMTSGLIGAGAGAATGLVTGVAGADEAVDKRKEEVVSQYDRNKSRMAQNELLAAQISAPRQPVVPQPQMGLQPTQGLPQKPADGPRMA
ncbi:MAG: hypothetical protein AB7L92_08500 [Alphaproteobacteria bacterium]